MFPSAADIANIVMTNSIAKAPNSIAKATNSIAKLTNSKAKVTNWMNSIAKTYMMVESK